MLRFDSLVRKSIFVIKFACANLVLKTLVAKVLNFEVSISLSWLWLFSLFSILVILVSWSVFLNKLIMSGLLFETVVNAAFVAKLLVIRILFLLLVIKSNLLAILDVFGI